MSCILLAGCSMLDLDLLESRAPRPSRSLPACAIGVLGTGSGRGAIVGASSVLTVAHVVGLSEEPEVAGTVLWTRARIVRRWASWPESIVLLELPIEGGTFGFDGFETSRIVRPGPGAPAWLVRESPCAWGERLYPGDSGSPILSSDASLVALVYGETITHVPVALNLPPGLRGTAGP